MIFGNVKLKMNVIKEIMSIGFLFFFVEIVFLIIIFFYNLELGINMGESGIVVYSIINYIIINIYLMFLGVGLGV